MPHSRNALCLALATVSVVGCGRSITTASGPSGATGGSGGVGQTSGVLSTSYATGANGTGTSGSKSSGSGVASSGALSSGSGVGSTGALSSGTSVSSTGTGMTCASYGDSCTNCISGSCSQVWCNCKNTPECLAAFQCWEGCGTNQSCIDGCTKTHSGGVSQALLVDNCAATTCHSSCTWGQPVPPCTQCIYQDCTSVMNACFHDSECIPLLDCLDACNAQSVVCAQQCYNQHGAGAMALQPVIDCTNQSCHSVCT